MSVTIADVLRLAESESTIVPMNQVAIAFWPPETTIRYLATGGLNSCTGIAVISSEAGILAHIAPLPPGSTQRTLETNPNAAIENARVLLQAVSQLYQANQDHFRTSETYVVAGIFNNSPAMPDVIRVIQRFFAGLGLQVIWRSYPVVAEGPRPEGFSSIVVHAERPGYMPKVYINGHLVN